MHYDGSQSQKSHGFQAHIGPMRPTASGHVKLRSADPRDYPSILFNYMATAQDRQEMRDGINLTREIFAQKAFDPFRGRELSPGPDVKSDDQIDAYVRAHAESAYHPSCTCKMGEDELAVVDSEGRVHGLHGLRVIDASIMPSIVSGNLNAPTIMMAEKLADKLKGVSPLAAEEVPVFIHPQWESRQR
jgi:choline dehydrogenase